MPAPNENQNGKVFGRQILSATLVNRKGNKEFITPVNFSIGHGEIEIYTTDWKKCLHLFSISEATAEQEGDNMVRIKYSLKTGTQGDLCVRYERCDIIMNAFPQTPTEKKGSESSITVVSFTDVLNFACASSSPNAQNNFKLLLEAQARKRVLFLSSSVDISESLVSAIACEFRMRFPQIEPENWSEAFEVLWLEFVAFAVSLWTQCLKTAIEPHTGPNSIEYYRRLTASISALMARGADVFHVDRRALLLATRTFLDSGDSSGVPAASRALVSDVELALGNIRKRWLLQMTDLFEFTQLFSCAITIAQSIAGELKELQSMTSLLCSWSIGCVNNLIRGPRLNEFRSAIDKLSISVLKSNDSKRYAPEFHCTLALWKLTELAKSSD